MLHGKARINRCRGYDLGICILKRSFGRVTNIYMDAVLNRIVMYAKNVNRMAEFYKTHFGFAEDTNQIDGIVELIQRSSGFSLLIHPAGKAVKPGQVSVKLVFSVKDVEKFCAKSLKSGLRFGSIHQSDGYAFSNAKDPEKNSIQISSRAFR